MPDYLAALHDAEKNCVKATAATVNITAANTRKNAQENIKDQFINRNNFTEKSVLYTQSPKSTKKLGEIKSETGITKRTAYMERQEKGGTKKAPSGSNLTIPTTAARGGSNASKVRQRYTYDNVIKNTIHWSKRFEKEGARIVATAFIAAREKKFMRINDAFFRITNFRKTKSGVKFRMKEILNLKHKTTETPKNEWLKPASEDAAKDMQAIFNSQMDNL